MDKFIKLIFLALFGTFALSRGDCPDNYFEGPNGNCYSYQYSSSSSGSYWATARLLCSRTNNSDLIILDDEAEYNWFVNLTSTVAPNSSWWLGYHDSSVEGDWRWVDCGETTEWHRTLWSPGYPGNDRNDCGVLLPSGEIDDVVCDIPVNYFLCEISPKDFSADEARPTNLTAETTSTLTVSLKWDVSPFNCDVFGYRVKITDGQMGTTQETVYGGNTNELLISLDRVKTDYSFTLNTWTILNGELDMIGPVTASTGSCPVDFEESPGGRCYHFRVPTNGEWWTAGRRSCDDTEDGDLVIINNEEEWNFIMNRTAEIDPDGKWWIGLSDLTSEGDWRWVDCTESNNWQDNLWGPGYPTSENFQDCAILHPNGTIQDGGCDLRLNTICEISPKEFDEDTVLVDDLMISGSSTTSLEVTWSVPQYGCSVVGYRIYYSMEDSMDERKFMYVSGGDITHTIIQDLRANTTYNVTVAVYINKDYELGESPAVEGSTMPCPANYEEGPNGHCYWFSVTPYGYMWYWGRQDCAEETDSDLVIVSDEEELDFLRTRVAELSGDDRDWWIGLSGSPYWSWVDCTEPNPWQDTLWAPGNPRPDSYGCAVLNASGQIIDTGCDIKHHFICEIYPRGFSGEDQNVQDMKATPLMYGMEVSWTLAPLHCDVEAYTVTYREDVEGSREFSAFQYGEDSTSTTVTGLYPNRTYNVSVAALLNTNVLLTPVGPEQVTTPPCPDNYEEGPNGHCYRFRILDDGTRWMRGRQTCDNVDDSDYVIINDEEELNYLLNRSAEVDPDMTWWIGLSDLSSPGSWEWVDCSTPTPWQAGLWAPTYPTGARSRCAALQPDGSVVDFPCETRLSYLCELLPKGFDADAIMVQNVTVEEYSNYINVRWVLPENNCDAIGYVIYYQLSDGTGERKSVYVNGGESTSGAVKALPLGTSYSLTVAVSTSKEMELQETPPINASTASSCPTNYEEGPNGGCYRFIVDDVGTWWHYSRQGCIFDVDYSDLLVINDQEELDFVMNRTAEMSANASWWIGYSDQSVEGTWQWLDTCQESTTFQESLWAPDYPSIMTHDCAALQPSGEVVDLVCDALVRGYVCEIAAREFDWSDANVEDLTATGIMYGLEVTWTVSSTSCDVIGYRITYQLDEPGSDSEFMIVYGGDADSAIISGLLPERRYSVGVGLILSLDAELSPVTTVGTTLTCPNNYEEGPNGHCYRFRILDSGSHWPTGRRTCDNVEDSDLAVIDDPGELAFLVNRSAEINPNMTWWIGLSDLYVAGEWRWVDCTTTTSYQDTLWAPDYPSDMKLTCAALQPSGDVINLPCDRRFSYLCELYPKGFDLNSQVVENVRATGGMYTIDVTWDLPENGCNAVGYKIYYEITGEDSDVFRSVYVNGGDSVNGTVFDLRANTSYNISVAIMTSKDIELGRTEPVTLSTDECPDIYEEGPNGHCYRFRILDYGSTWPTGRRTCDNVEDSDLAVINDPEELAFLVNRSAEIDPTMTWWIGLSDLHVAGEWRWVDCSTPTSYHNTLWAPDYPSDDDLTCAALQPSGDIINLSCDRKFSYLCELYPTGFDLNSQVVENVRATGGMYTIDVTWELPENGCNAVGYKIYYEITGEDSDVFTSVYVNGGESMGGSVTGLHANTSYNITVAIMTSKDIELGRTEPITLSTVPCPENYEEGPNGHCYRFRILEYGSWWPTGRRTCDNEPDSDLAIIDDPTELDFLINRTAEIDPNIMWWIGYSDQSVEGDWRWIDCSESSRWQDTLWVPGHPGNGRLDCAALQPDGQIVDLVCDTPLSYLCEIAPKGFRDEDANPHDLNATATTYGLEVTWTVSMTSCDVIGYRISYYLTGDISTRASIFVYGGDTSSVVVRGMLPNTTYDVTIAAHTSKDVELSPVGPVTATTEPCPDDYSLAPNGRCYRFVEGSPSFWHYTRETCMTRKDSDLVIINDQEELDYIMQQINATGDTNNWWIGYHDTSVEGEWRWVDCTESDNWQMSLWAPGSPSNEMPDCGSLTSSGEIEAQVCDVRFNFVCEVSPKGFDPTELKVENLETSGASYGVEISWSVPENACDVYGYKIYYQEMENDREEFKIIYGGDSTGARIQGLLPNTTVNISVAVLISAGELERVGPVLGQSDPCPTGYEEAANGRCYRFHDFGRYGNDWDNTRFYCSEPGYNFEQDLMIIDDEWELEYITNRTKEFNDSRDWRIGYSDLSVEGDWRWITCASSNDWQKSLWAEGYPQNGLDDCGVFDPDTMTIYDQVCDTMNINYICEVTPKDFDRGDENVFNVNATAIAWDTVRVTWNVSEYNCDVVLYKIYYLDTFLGGKPEWALVYGGGVDSYDLTMLQPSTRYSITVAGERIDAELPQVGPVYVTTPEGPCPAYYESGPNGGCYRFVTSEYGSIWSSGRSGCAAVDDSDLVIIDDQAEFEFIVNRTKDFYPIRDWWIGFSDFSVESDWRWLTCDAPTDWQNTIWETGYPRNGLHDCGALSSTSGQVIDDVCDKPNYYICEITPKDFTSADMNVRDVMASPLSNTEIDVSWVLSNITCDVYGYKIYYGPQGEPLDITQFHVVYGGNVSSLTVPGLSPSMTYVFHVAALIPDRLELPRIGPANATTYSECGRIIVDGDGMIMSADYPNGYYGPETCEWLISAPVNQFVLLQILNFDTRAGVDFVVIGSGVDFSSESTLYVLSGSKDNAGTTPIPDKILSPDQHLWISFKTSESTLDHAGFLMYVTMVTQGPGEPTRAYDEITEEGTLTSPGWPDDHPNFVDITWTLIGPKTGRVRMNSIEGVLESGYDTLTIGYGNPDSSVIATYTGDFKSDEEISSPTYNFWVRFKADETIANKGFTLYWESFDDQASCGSQELLEGSGSVMSPNYPQPYPDNQECTWFIRLPSMNHLVRVEFNAFSLEENHDFLVLGTGKTINEEVIVILTGDTLPTPVQSASYRMWLQFKSDESFSSTGFSLEYSSIDNPEPPTPYNEIADSVIFIVQNEPIGWFTPVRQEDLATAIATSMTDYCRDKSDTCEAIRRRRRDASILELTFSASDVEFLDTVAVENDLHITTWVGNPSMADEDIILGIEPEIVQTSLMEETSQTTIKDIMGEGFEYTVTPSAQPTTGGPRTDPPTQGLEPWAISLIVIGSFALVVSTVVGIEVRHRRKKRNMQTGDGIMNSQDLQTYKYEEEPEYASPLKRSERPSTSTYTNATYSDAAIPGEDNDGFDDGENTHF
ncbi:uncharacterized protein LOC121423607 [Lytechinus variegatus]|uniref:uncharacterized protein LOC121423607 n=1 Tax=Lytechinus variegatus TaxID=7654 RepID=UPI001BB266C1|nr:uncharacterized protein LOC121423607 [Lytechinus variegatus]